MATYTTYSTGTLDVTNGSATVVGVGTSWSAANSVYPNDKIVIAGVDYYIASIIDTTHITLTAPYAGVTASALTYIISDKLNPPPLTNGEPILVTGPLTVTITDVNTWAPQSLGSWIADRGAKLVIKNTSAVTGCRVRLVSSSLTIYGGSSVAFEGDWIQIGTGTGVSSQVVSTWDTTAQYVPCVWIETAPGSGVYDRWLNISGYTALHPVTLLSVGAGKYGRFFTQNAVGTAALTSGSAAVVGTSTTFTALTAGDTIVFTNGFRGVIQTITDNTHLTLTANSASTTSGLGFSTKRLYFGNSVNGARPANGAKIRVPNMILHREPTAGNVEQAVMAIGNDNVNYRGDISFTRCQLSSVQPQILVNNGTSFITSTSMGYPLLANGLESRLALTDVGYSPAGSPVAFIATLAYFAHVDFTDCSLWSQLGVFQTTRGDLTFTRCGIFSINSNDASVGTAAIYPSIGLLTIRDCYIAGAVQTAAAGGLDIDGLELVDNAHLSEVNAAANRYSVSVGSKNSKIYNLTIPAGGGIPNSVVIYTSAAVDIRRVNVYSTAFQRLVSLMNASNCRVIDCEIASVSGELVYGQDTTRNNVIQNVRQTNTPYKNKTTQIGTNAVIRGCAAIGIGAGRTDVCFADWYDDATQGTLFIRPFGVDVLNNTYVFYSGRVVPDSISANIFLDTDATVTYVWPWKIRGVTGFQNITPTLSAWFSEPPYGDAAAFAVLEYAIDTGNGYSAWKAATGTNLSAEVVDAVAGFGFKVRFSVTAPRMLYSGVVFRTNIDQSVRYPLDDVPIILQNVVVGTVYRIVDEATGDVIAAGVAAGTTVTIPKVAYYEGASTLALTLVHLDYLYIKLTGLSLGPTGLTIPIQQQRDRNYLNPP